MTGGGSFLSTGYARPVWFVMRLAGFFRGPSPRADDVALTRDEGRRVCTYPIRERVSGVFVRVSGSVQFERALIGFADGRVQAVNAFGLERSNGLFCLAEVAREDTVDWVRLVVRARSRAARVGVRLAR